MNLPSNNPPPAASQKGSIFLAVSWLGLASLALPIAGAVPYLIVILYQLSCWMVCTRQVVGADILSIPSVLLSMVGIIVGSVAIARQRTDVPAWGGLILGGMSICLGTFIFLLLRARNHAG